jgi:hypothetical protein
MQEILLKNRIISSHFRPHKQIQSVPLPPTAGVWIWAIYNAQLNIFFFLVVLKGAVLNPGLSVLPIHSFYI